MLILQYQLRRTYTNGCWPLSIRMPLQRTRPSLRQRSSRKELSFSVSSTSLTYVLCPCLVNIFIRRRRLQVEVDEFKREMDDDDLQKFRATRRELYRKVLSWKETQLKHMPGLSDVLSKERDNTDDSCDLESENVRLYLPSEFSNEERAQYKLESIAQIKLELRKGEANDAIQDLCLQINFRTALEGQKVHVKYTKGNTRAGSSYRSPRTSPRTPTPAPDSPFPFGRRKETRALPARSATSRAACRALPRQRTSTAPAPRCARPAGYSPAIREKENDAGYSR